MCSIGFCNCRDRKIQISWAERILCCWNLGLGSLLFNFSYSDPPVLFPSRYGGIGIAGPQIGWRERVFCFGMLAPSERYPHLNPDTLPFQFWINPKVTAASNAQRSWFWEGCLSVPGMRGWVERPDTVYVEGLDVDGEKKSTTLTGMAARVFQHEFDHLDGVLFTQRVELPTLLVPSAAFDAQHKWKEGWPTPSARACRPGQLWYEESK